MKECNWEKKLLSESKKLSWKKLKNSFLKIIFSQNSNKNKKKIVETVKST